MAGSRHIARLAQKLFLSGAAAAGLGPPTLAQAVLTRDQAVVAVGDQIALPAESLVWCPHVDFGFGPGFEGALPPGSVIRPAELDIEPYFGNEVRLTGPMYLFWHDYEPRAEFTHLTEFILVDATDPTPTLAEGTILVQTQGWWPLISVAGDPFAPFFGPNQRYTTSNPSSTNAEGLVLGDLLQPDDRVLPDPPTRGDVVAADRDPPGLPTANPCVVIASGSSDDWFGNNVDLMKKQFRDRGVAEDRIKTMKNATYAEVEALIESLCPTATNPPNPACDKIFFYFASHGGVNSLCFKDGSKNAEMVCRLLKKIGDKNVPACIYLQACNSGSLVDDIRSNVKFPAGVSIITSAESGKSSSSGPCRKADGTKIFPTAGQLSELTALFIQCWNDATADTDGDMKVSWAEAFAWVVDGHDQIYYRARGGVITCVSVEDPGPSINGRPPKYQRWNAPGAPRKYFDCYQDTDNDGKYDKTEWWVDRDGDGVWDAFYRECDADEDGKNEKKFCFQDTDDNGSFDVRLEFIDKNDDGVVDRVERASWNGADWVVASIAPFRQLGGLNVFPPGGPQNGGASAMLASVQPILSDDLSVVIGSGVAALLPQGPNQFQLLTEGYFAGPQDVLLIDWQPSSPTFGVTVQPKAYQYDLELELLAFDPPVIDPSVDNTLRILGHGLAPGGTVQFMTKGPPLPPLPYNFLDPTTLELPIPADFFNPGSDPFLPIWPLDAQLQLSDGRNRLLEQPFVVLSVDLNPPEIACPPPLKLTLPPGADWLPLPPDFFPTASDPEGNLLRVVGLDVGALPSGTIEIEFEALDLFGNRSRCTTPVTVQGSPPLVGDMNCDGVVSVSDIAGFVLALTDPAGYAAQFPDCDIQNGDVNGDNFVTVSDIGPFVKLLTGG